MISNQNLLEGLFAQHKIAVQRSDLFDSCPPALPEQLGDRIEGMLLGLAIGDSLGNTTEGQLPDERGDRYGEIRDYLPNHHAAGRPVGLPSDDTQLAFWTLEQLIADAGLVPEHLAECFCRQRVFGIGNTVADFIHNYRYRKQAWYEAGPRSAGNGALMRIAPVLIPHLRNPTAALWVDTALAAMITHNDPASIGSCLALVSLLWEALRTPAPPRPEWWVDTFCSVLRPLEGETHYRSHGRGETYDGPLWRFTATRVREALGAELSVAAACDHWYSGAYLLETVPSVLYILGCCAHDPEEAILRAVNDTWDNDTIAAIVGAAVGALHGRSRLPQRWIDGLLGRTGEADDGRVQELITRAGELWWRS